MMHDLDRQPVIPYPQRLVQGQVIRCEADVLHFHLDTQDYDLPETQIPRRARVRQEDWAEQQRMGAYPEGSRHRLFLLRPTREDPHLWRASLRWAQDDDNPWNPESLRRLKRGDQVNGIVTQYIGDYAALVRLTDSGVDAFLHRINLPETQVSIQHCLHIGDRIQANIMLEGTDFERLRINLSVNEVLATSKQAFLERYHHHQHTATQAHEIQVIHSNPIENLPFVGRHLLLVEHDAAYAKQLRELIEGMGGKVETASHPQQITSLLKAPLIFTHIISDYQMGTERQRDELFGLLQRSRLPVALMSGDYTEASQIAQHWGWGVLYKPISYAVLRQWLIDGKLPAAAQNHEDIAASWHFGVESQATLGRALSVLGDFCRETHTLAACWMRQQREGVYATLSTYGLPDGLPENIAQHLSNTLVANAIDNQQAISRPTEHAGSLRDLANILLANSVWCLPLQSDSNTDALLLFTILPYRKDGLPPKNWDMPFSHLNKRLADVSTMTLLTERLREAESFATLGRVSGALLHELRQAMQGLETYSQLALRRLERGQATEATQSIQEVIRAKERVLHLVRADLYNLQKARREEVLLNQRVPEILSWFSPQFQRHPWLPSCELPDPPITIWLPPEVVEQPLINLLDNALHHLHEDWGEVRIVVRRVPEDTTCPIHIEIYDQGKGMTAEQLDQLFTPRISDKGTKGYGLGLYTSRQLLRAVGGELEVIRSACFRWLGSGFRLRLPDQKIKSTPREGI